MLDLDLLVAVAGIAGVFVGFGALISATGDAEQLWLVRTMVTGGLEVIVAALIPVVLASYGVGGRDLLVASAAAFLAIDWAVILFLHSRRDYMAFRVLQERGARAALGVQTVALEIPLQAALVIVILGVFPAQDAALYLTAVVLALVQAAGLLVIYVYTRGRPATA
jgi:hypothetical protein